MKKFILIIFIAGMISSVQAQQDSQFTQYLFNGIHINPAYTGYKGDIYIQSFTSIVKGEKTIDSPDVTIFNAILFQQPLTPN